jgi:hypothetical protein
MQNGDRFPVPEEYHEYLICKLLGKFPSEVEGEPARDIYRLLTMMAVENEVRNGQQGG